MSFSFSSLMAAFIYSVIGFFLLRHGRRTTNYHHSIIGLVLMFYPYFVSGPLLEWGIGAALCLLAYSLKD